MAERIHHAITLASEEKCRRMRRMREIVRRNDIYWWLERFLRELLDPRARTSLAMRRERPALAELRRGAVERRAES